MLEVKTKRPDISHTMGKNFDASADFALETFLMTQIFDFLAKFL